MSQQKNWVRLRERCEVRTKEIAENFYWQARDLHEMWEDAEFNEKHPRIVDREFVQDPLALRVGYTAIQLRRLYVAHPDIQTWRDKPIADMIADSHSDLQGRHTAPQPGKRAYKPYSESGGSAATRIVEEIPTPIPLPVSSNASRPNSPPVGEYKGIVIDPKDVANHSLGGKLVAAEKRAEDAEKRAAAAEKKAAKFEGLYNASILHVGIIESKLDSERKKHRQTKRKLAVLKEENQELKDAAESRAYCECD